VIFILGTEACTLRPKMAAEAAAGVAKRIKSLRFNIEHKPGTDRVFTSIGLALEHHQNEGLY
jgi:hypothetical protein